jgi:UDP-glucose 4-epimerase
MKDNKIVVTGGAGFIGSNLTRELSEENHVLVLDDLSTGNIENIQDCIETKKIEFINGTITDINLLQKIFKNVDFVFHQAAIPSVPRSVKDPISSNYATVNGTLNVLVAARDNNVKKVVFASSSSVYGDTPTLPKVETMKLLPLSPYAVGKLASEYYCQVFTNIYNLKTVSLRYFNVYGPRQDPSSEYAAVIPKFITRVAKDEPPVIYGDGEQTRDFTYIKDVLSANILAAEHDDVTGIFNIAGGKRITLNDLARLIMTVVGKEMDPIYDDVRPGDIKHSIADIEKAKKELNYVQKFDIKEGLLETKKWFLKEI